MRSSPLQSHTYAIITQFRYLWPILAAVRVISEHR